MLSQQTGLLSIFPIVKDNTQHLIIFSQDKKALIFLLFCCLLEEDGRTKVGNYSWYNMALAYSVFWVFLLLTSNCNETKENLREDYFLRFMDLCQTFQVFEACSLFYLYQRSMVNVLFILPSVFFSMATCLTVFRNSRMFKNQDLKVIHF